MVPRALGISMLLLTGVVVAGVGVAAVGATSSAARIEPNAPSFAVLAPVTVVAAQAPDLTASLVAAAATPVYEDSDSLAFRDLVAQSTESMDGQPSKPSASGHLVRVKVLGFNDFHGHLSTTRVLEGPPIGRRSGSCQLSPGAHARLRGT